MNERHIKETELLYEDMRVLRHELKNHDFYIKTLLENKEYAVLEEYFERRNDVKKKSLIDTGNITVNAILNAKMEEAKEKNITVDVIADLPSELPIQNGDLVSLISNIWDNAMEHSDVVNPAIRAKLEIVKAYLSIVISNRVSSDVLKENPMLKTSKNQAFRHGIGVKVIRQVTEKYDGITDFKVEENWFTVSILLKMD